MEAQRQRRGPVTYGKLFANRRRVSNLSEQNQSLEKQRPQDNGPSTVAIQSTSSMLHGSGSTTGSFTKDSSNKQNSNSQLKSSKLSVSKSSKPLLARSNSAADVMERGIFDVPSSDEEPVNTKPVFRRAVSALQKKEDASRLSDKEKSSSARITLEKVDKKPVRHVATLEEALARAERECVPKLSNNDARAGSELTTLIPATISTYRTVNSKAISTSFKNSAGRSEPSALSPGCMEVVQKRTIKSTSVVTEEKRKTTIEIPVTVNESKTQRPRLIRDGEFTQKVPKDSTALELSRQQLSTAKNVVTESNQKKSAPPPQTQAPASVTSIYIPSPTLDPEQYPPLKYGELLSKQSDGQYGTTPVPREQLVTRKVMMKRAREPGTTDQEIEREATPPRRRRLIDTLEIDQSVNKLQRRPIDHEMDVDSEGDTEGLQMMALDDSQSQAEKHWLFNDDAESSQQVQLAFGTAPTPSAYSQRTSRVTYGRQRSFLTEEVKDGDDPFADPLLLPARELGRKLRSAPILDDLEEEEVQNSGMVKSLHELREAGVNKRFLDNVEGYFEDIEGNVSIGQKRAGCIELVTKLRDKSFLHKFRANNFESRLLVDFRKQTDEIIRFVLSFMVWTFLEDDANAPVLQLVHENGIISMLDSMLDSTREILLIAKDKKTNMSKAAQSLVADFCNLIKKSKIFNKLPKVLSPQVMALATLDAVIRGLRQAGWMGDCLPIAMVRKLVKILEPFQGERDLEKRKRIDPLLVEIPVSILESHSIGSESARETELSNEELGTLANILPGVMDFEGDDFTSVQLLTLRLSINLTNHRPVVCDTFGRQDIISRLVGIAQAKFQALSGPLEENRRSVELDFLILSLALMINFAEMSDAARLAFIQGPKEIPQLDTLLLLFLERLGRAAEADSMEESQSNVGFGYLSILLGNLCQNTTVRNLVRSKMPEKTLAPLVNAVLEFVSHNRKVDEEADEESWHKGYTERLEQVAVRLQNIEGFS